LPSDPSTVRPTAVVMNMFYTGLGIARSLGERGVAVTGLSSHRGVYGNYTRFAKVEIAPCSRAEPEALAEWLAAFGKKAGGRNVIFPTRDDDVLFLDRYRDQLAPWFVPVIAPRAALQTCLSKWETFQLAQRTGVPAPRCWVVKTREEMADVAAALTYPCVMKPVASYDWRQGDNWARAGGRKAIGIAGYSELCAEYEAIAGGDPRVLIQEMIPGPDDRLVIAAVYMDRKARWSAAFNTRKLLQIPEGFGTGCVVEATDRPEVFEPAHRLLEEIGYTGIAEVEFKWDDRTGQYSLIEINPRPWDQHRLGVTCGTDLMWIAYLDHAGLPAPAAAGRPATHRYIADEAFWWAVLRGLYHRDGSLRKLLAAARGPRIWGIWSARDPLPFLAFVFLGFVPTLAGAAWQTLARAFRAKATGDNIVEKSIPYENSLGKGNSGGR
jgi:D-aspartate ligase